MAASANPGALTTPPGAAMPSAIENAAPVGWPGIATIPSTSGCGDETVTVSRRGGTWSTGRSRPLRSVNTVCSARLTAK